MCKNFSHLHVHTDASEDGVTPVEVLVKRASELGFTALAMTDHGTLANAVSFWSACNDFGIKPIFGLEAYMEWNGKRHHITLNSRSRAGFENLIKISNAAHVNFTSGYPLLTPEMMAAHPQGISLFTGCPASPIHQGSHTDGLNFVSTMVDIYGKSNVAVEMMFAIDDDITSRPFKIAKQLDLPMIVTNDVHYPVEKLKRVHRILTECRKGFSYNSDRLWLKSSDEMILAGRRLFDESEVSEWMQNAWLFGESVEPFSMAAKPTLPKAEGLRDAFHESISAALEVDLIGRNEFDRATRLERFDIEIKTLEEMGFIDYFCILNDIITWARSNNILIGPGRGSAAGSYILFILGITGIDPLDHGLYFERFLNPSRKEYPDVDIDIESDRRQEVIDYATRQWGAYPVATYSHYSHKSLINDLGRVLKIERGITEAASESVRDSEQFDTFVHQHPDALDSYNAILGQIRHAGKHAGGIIITDQAVPLEQVGDAIVAAWTEGYDKQLSKVGVVKYDLLGLTALSQIKLMRALTGVNEVPPAEESPEVFDLFCNGNVLGIFQWTGSDGIRDLTMKIKPRKFADLTVINSLYRPGALDAGTAKDYPKYMLKPRRIHPDIDPILEDTNGVIVFQEQVMMIFSVVTGGSLADADLSRRTIFKPRFEEPEWVKKFEGMRSDFFIKGEDRGMPKSVLELMWAEIVTHTRYSFNRAHAAAYAIVAYEMAWFKTHHPAVFYAVMCKYDLDTVQTYLMEAADLGIKLTNPHINRSTNDYQVLEAGNEILFPLNIVKFLSSGSVQKVMAERDTNGPFKSIDDFRKRIKKRDCTSRVCRYLYYLGAFDGLEGDRGELFVEEVGAELTGGEAEIEALGFRLPNPASKEFIDLNSDGGNNVAGYVHHWKDKINKKGNLYRIYHLRPSGTFWTDDRKRIEKIKGGDLLAVLKNAWGKASKITRRSES